MTASAHALPETHLKVLTDAGIQSLSLTELCSKGKSVVFGLPGAFTPLCSRTHAPAFIEKAEALAHKGVDRILCLSVNDPFVMKAWKDALGAHEDMLFLSDWNGAWHRALDLTFDGAAHGLGERAKRYSMLIQEGHITHLEIDETPAVCNLSSAQHILNLLG